MPNPNETQIQINLADYVRGKKEGTTRLIKIDGVVKYAQRRFRESDGKPVPILIDLDKDMLLRAIKEKEEELVVIKELVLDINAAAEVSI